MKLRFAKKTEEEVKRLQKLFAQISFMMRDPLIEYVGKQRIIVAEEEGIITGLLQISAKKDKILALITDSNYRQKGIGRKLFNFAKQVYQLRDIKILAMPLSIPFWQKLGFKETGKVHQTKRQLLTEMIY